MDLDSSIITDGIQVILSIGILIATIKIGIIASKITSEQNKIASYEVDIMDAQTSTIEK